MFRRKHPTLIPILLILYVIIAVLKESIIDAEYCQTSYRFILQIIGYPVFVSAISLIWFISTYDFKDSLATSSICNENDEICQVCQSVRPTGSKAHHCRVCNRCVMHFDHHCDVLDACITDKNIIFFKILLFLGSIGHCILMLTAECFAGTTLQSWVRISHSISKDGFVTVLITLISEIWRMLFVTVYQAVSYMLGIVFLIYVLLPYLDLSWSQVIKAIRDGLICDVIYNKYLIYLHKFAERLASSISRLHDTLSLTNPSFCLSGRCINPHLRWVINLIVPFPFGYYAVQVVWYVKSSLFEKVLMLVAIVLMVLGTYFQRKVCVSITNFKTSIPNSDVEYCKTGRHYCNYCERLYVLQDHHCGGFGTCIHKHNRFDYMWFCGVTSTCFALFFPFARQNVWKHWNITLSNFPWTSQIKELIFPMLCFQGVLCGSTIFFLFWLQQVSYLLLKAKIKERLDYLGNEPSSTLMEFIPFEVVFFCRCMFGSTAVDRFLPEIIGELQRELSQQSSQDQYPLLHSNLQSDDIDL